MKIDAKEIEVNGVAYVPKSDAVNAQAQQLDGMKYVIVRTYTAGVFAGYLKNREGKEVTLVNARRLWYWVGAATLSQLAEEGVNKPENCKFPCEVQEVTLTEAIEVLNATETAKKAIGGVKIWKQ